MRQRHGKLTPTPKLRHNDSQIKFATIDSSPSGPEGPESQFLTTRQREVKVRQHQEAAAMFPDLRSSPRPKSRDATAKPSRLNLSSDVIVKDDDMAEEIVSPTLPPANAMTTTFLGSSPTPSSSRKRFGGNDYDDGPPSSPPVVSKAKPRRGLVESEQQHFTPTGSPSIQKLTHAEIEPDVDSAASTTGAEHGPLVTQLHEVEGPVTGPEVPSEDQEMKDVNLNSDFEVFVDAPAEPRDQGIHNVDHADRASSGNIAKVPGDLQASSPNSSPRVSCSFGEEDLSEEAEFTVLTEPEDEVSAQIAYDMEMALSQAAEGSQKRKRSPSLEQSVKKRVSTGLLGSVQVVIEKRSPARDESDVLDCIVVASPAVEALSSSAGMNTLDQIAGASSQQVLSTSSAELADRPMNKDMSLHGSISRGGRGHGRKRGRPRRITTDVPPNYDSSVLSPDSVAVGGMKKAGKTGRVVGPEGANLTASLSSSSSSFPVEDAALSNLGSQAHEPATGMGILERLKLMLEEAKAVVLSPGEGREIISTWMDLGRELQNADSRAVP